MQNNENRDQNGDYRRELDVWRACGSCGWRRAVAAVIEIGAGEGFWDCRYRTVEECVPNVLAGNRGTCSPNPYGSGLPPFKRHYKHHLRHG
jgi:hypothetical protein